MRAGSELSASRRPSIFDNSAGQRKLQSLQQESFPLAIRHAVQAVQQFTTQVGRRPEEHPKRRGAPQSKVAQRRSWRAAPLECGAPHRFGCVRTQEHTNLPVRRTLQDETETGLAGPIALPKRPPADRLAGRRGGNPARTVGKCSNGAVRAPQLPQLTNVTVDAAQSSPPRPNQKSSPVHLLLPHLLLSICFDAGKYSVADTNPPSQGEFAIGPVVLPHHHMH